MAASSLINGTPQNKRGHKDDAISFTCTVFQPVFHVGQKVQVVSSIYGYDDVLPIRVMRITFANPWQAIFELTLSHEIDEAWSTFESVWPKITLPKTPRIKPPPPPPPGGGCDDAACGITDTFNREDTEFIAGPGLADCGYLWDPGRGYIQDNQLWIGSGSDNQDFVLHMTGTLPFPLNGSYLLYHVGGFNDHGIRVNLNGLSDALRVTYNEFVGELTIELTDGTNSVSTTAGSMTPVSFPIVVSFAVTPDTASVTWSGTTLTVSRLDASPSPIAAFTTASEFGFYHQTSGGNVDKVDTLDIVGLSGCAVYIFDDFNRVLSDSWGTSDSGEEWVIDPTGNDPTGFSTGGGLGSKDTGGSNDIAIAWPSSSFDITIRVRLNETDNRFYWGPLWDWTGADAWQIQFIQPGGGVLYMEAGTSSESDSVAVDWTYTTAEWVTVKASFSDGFGRVKAWTDEQDEPDWQLGPFSSSGTNFSHFNITAYSLDVDFIALDYEGRPCVSANCAGALVENFNRDVADGWGNGWLRAWLANNNGQGSVSVSPGLGIITAATRDGGSSLNNSEWVWRQGTGSSAWDTTGVALSADFRYSKEPTTTQLFITFAWGSISGTGEPPPNSGTYQVNTSTYVFVQVVTGEPFLNIGVTGSSTVTTNVAATPGALYHLKATMDPFQAKVWADGSTEPDYQTTSAVSRDVGQEFMVGVNYFGNSSTATDKETVTFTGIGFGECVDVQPTPGVPTSGLARETLTYTNGTTYTTSRAYQGGSTEVFVNGLRSPVGNGGYTETDPSTGAITFDTPLASTDVVSVSYQAQGVTQGPQP